MFHLLTLGLPQFTLPVRILYFVSICLMCPDSLILLNSSLNKSNNGLSLANGAATPAGELKQYQRTIVPNFIRKVNDLKIYFRGLTLVTWHG